MAAASLAKGGIEFTAFLLVGFAGLLRTMEALSLKVEQLKWLENGTLAISSPSTKSTRSRDGVEMVVIDDPLVVAAVRLAIAETNPTGRLCGRSQADAGVQVWTSPSAVEFVPSAARGCHVAFFAQGVH